MDNITVDFYPTRPIRIVDLDFDIKEELSFDQQITYPVVNLETSYELPIETEVSLTCLNFEITAELTCKIGGGGQYPDYTGGYVVIPKAEDQELLTKDKVLKRNVLVKEVPTWETPNPEGGFTFKILY